MFKLTKIGEIPRYTKKRGRYYVYVWCTIINC